MKHFHYAWIVVVVTFLALLVAQAVRAAPGMITTPRSHMLGAAIAAFAGGFFRHLRGDYHLMFVPAGILGFVAIAPALRISTSAVTTMSVPVLEAARP